MLLLCSFTWSENNYLKLLEKLELENTFLREIEDEIKEEKTKNNEDNRENDKRILFNPNSHLMSPPLDEFSMNRMGDIKGQSKCKNLKIFGLGNLKYYFVTKIHFFQNDA